MINLGHRILAMVKAIPVSYIPVDRRLRGEVGAQFRSRAHVVNRVKWFIHLNKEVWFDKFEQGIQ